MRPVLVAAMLVLAGALAVGLAHSRRGSQEKQSKESGMNERDEKSRTATLAGGRFWCLEADFEKVDGVVEVISGYTGGHTEAPRTKK
jgi:peptide methionine sulfoxide reductase msrA/msrB